MSQLPFRFGLSPRYGAEDFLVSGSNAAAFAAVERWPDWPDRVLLLIGAPGSGKTHLAHLWSQAAGGRHLRPGDFAGDLGAIAAAPAVLDDADTERPVRGWRLLTAARPPDAWGVATPDLLSRLRLAPSVGLEPPDDVLVRSVLVKLFDDRQVRVEESLIDYLTLRLDRSLGIARTVVDALDSAGLSRGRRITRALASDVLRSLRLDGD